MDYQDLLQKEADRLRSKGGRRFLLVMVDMDDTLTLGTAWTAEDCLNAVPNVPMIIAMNYVFRGEVVIIYTARKDDLMSATHEWVKRNGIYNCGISNDKCPADIYIDDKAFNPF